MNIHIEGIPMGDALKYSKYFLNELAPEQREQGFGKSPMFTIWTDDDIIKGSHCFSAMIMGPEDQRKGMLFLGEEG